MAKSKVNIQPLADRVVVKAAEAETKTKSGIFIPDNALGEDRMSKGRVVGTSRRRIETSGEFLDPKFDLDDLVLFGKGSGNPFKFDGFDLVILGEDEVFGTIVE